MEVRLNVPRLVLAKQGGMKRVSIYDKYAISVSQTYSQVPNINFYLFLGQTLYHLLPHCILALPYKALLLKIYADQLRTLIYIERLKHEYDAKLK